MPVLLVLLAVAGLPLLEIMVFIEVGSEIGAFTTIALTVITAASGLVLARVQGMSILVRMNAALSRGEVPVADLLRGIGILLGALLLLIPGFVSDAVGLLLLVPPVRALLMPGVVAAAVWHRARRRPGEPIIIDGEFSDLDRSGNGATLGAGQSGNGAAGPPPPTTGERE